MRSEVFNRMLAPREGMQLKEAETGEIDMSEYGRDTVLAMLRFLYTGELRQPGLRQARAQLLDLLRAAHYYQLPRLLSRVQDRLLENKVDDPAAALEVLCVADQLECKMV
eukprot:tig00020911_g15736.t1